MYQKKYVAVLIIVLSLAISYLHYSTMKEEHALHSIYAELYYIPILLGAVIFGLKGAILTYLFVSVIYLPMVFTTWTNTLLLDKILHIVFSGAIAFLAGFLVDRENKLRKQSEKDRYLAGVGQVSTVIVHDLKNPLTAILGFAKRIKDGKGNSETAAQTIIESAQEMQKIVYDVLDFAKPVNLTFAEEDIRTVVSHACNSCMAKAESAGIKLSILLPADPLHAFVDSSHIERSLVNLLNNAIEASAKDHDVTISLIHEKDNAIITIRDKGIGMDKKSLENLFTPFYTQKKTGTGLGMSISKKIIEGHHGGIHIDSQPDMGTEVTISLPLHATESL